MIEEINVDTQELTTKPKRSKTWLWILIAILITLVLVAGGVITYKILIFDKLLETNADLDGQIKQYEERLKTPDVSGGLLSQVTSNAIVFNNQLYWGDTGYGNKDIKIYQLELVRLDAPAKVEVVYDSSRDNKIQNLNEDKDRYVSEFKVIDNQLYAIIRGDMAHGALIKINDYSSENIFISYGPDIIKKGEKTLITSSSGEACVADGSYYLYDSSKKQESINKLLNWNEDCGKGLIVLGNDNDNFYLADFDDSALEINDNKHQLLKFYKVAIQVNAKQIEIEQTDLPQLILESPNYIFSPTN
jgi:hypothetical protein